MCLLRQQRELLEVMELEDRPVITAAAEAVAVKAEAVQLEVMVEMLVLVVAEVHTEVVVAEMVRTEICMYYHLFLLTLVCPEGKAAAAAVEQDRALAEQMTVLDRLQLPL